MKFTKLIPTIDDIRIQNKFLWLPKTIKLNQLKITRWMEKAKWKEVYMGGGYWVAIEWLDIK